LLKYRALLFVTLLLICASCELLYVPPASWLVFPIAEVSSDLCRDRTFTCWSNVLLHGARAPLHRS